jgi:hypothetical protein
LPPMAQLAFCAASPQPKRPKSKAQQENRRKARPAQFD